MSTPDDLIRYAILIDHFEIRIMKDFSGKGDFAQLVAIDEKGREHSFGYTDDDGVDHNVYVASPESGKIGWKPDNKS